MRKFIFNTTLLINGFSIKKARGRLEKYRSQSPEELLARRDRIVDYHLKHNALYKKLAGNRKIQKFEDLPVITKQDFQAPLPEIISDTFKPGGLYVANTSGSSGHPFFYAKNKESHSNTHYIAQQLYARLGITPADKQARFYGIPARGSARLKEKIKDALSNRIRFPVFDLSDQKLGEYLDKFKKVRFDYVYGYTSAIVAFAKYLGEKGIVLKSVCQSLKCCIVTSEMCIPEDRKLIEESFGVRVFNEYGCSEVGIIALENEDGIWEMTTSDCYYEVVDSDNKSLPYGSQGMMLITSLSNLAMPFIRYQIGDIGAIEPFGNGLKLIRLTGRVNDMVKLPGGRTAAGLTFYYISRSILENNSNISEFVVRQTSIDTFVFDVVSKQPLSPSEIRFLQEQMDLYLEPGLRLEINQVDRIARPSSGKIKHFYSEL